MKKKILLGTGILLGIVVISMIAIWVISDFAKNSNVDGVAITKQDVSAMGDISGDFVIPSTLNGRPVTSIGEGAFEMCSSLTSVTIPDSVTSIGNHAFLGCDNLWKDENGVQYESANKVVLIDVPELLIGNFVIPTSVRCIYSSAFLRCSDLTSVTIPDSVTTIGAWAFSWCSSLTSVTFEGVPPSIGLFAFDGSYPTGCYLPEHAAAWKSVLNEDGEWHGLKMKQR
jgi:hypothetical protein